MLNGVQVAVHFVADARLSVSYVVSVGVLPLDCVGCIASHDGGLHGDRAEEGIDHLCRAFRGQFEGLFDRRIVELLDFAELRRAGVELPPMVLLVVDKSAVAEVGSYVGEPGVDLVPLGASFPAHDAEDFHGFLDLLADVFDVRFEVQASVEKYSQVLICVHERDA